MANISINNYRLPTQEDFDGAMTAVMRLQDTYDLRPREIASGDLGKEQSLTMSSKCVCVVSGISHDSHMILQALVSLNVCQISVGSFQSDLLTFLSLNKPLL